MFEDKKEVKEVMSRIEFEVREAEEICRRRGDTVLHRPNRRFAIRNANKIDSVSLSERCYMVSVCVSVSVIMSICISVCLSVMVPV